VSGRVVLLACSSSVTRALLSSLVSSLGDELRAADSLPRAIAAAGANAPDVAIIEAAIVRASPDAIERLRQAWPEPVGVVLADRAYSDERRGAEEARAFGVQAFISLPTDAAALEDAMGRAMGASSRQSVHAAPVVVPDDVESAPSATDTEQHARYIERLWSRLDTLDAYQVLRVQPGASQEEIRTAFRERALEFHPDRSRPGADEALRERIYQIFKRVSWAFRKVGEPNARKEYDAVRARR
jgi:CheY-like chemotaxis protein